MKLLPRKALVVPSSLHISATLQKMIEASVSCVLVHDAQNNIVGIVTERDVIRKLALLKVEITLDRPINTVMTRPVEFVSKADILSDIRKLHLEKKRRHFPVLADPKLGAKVENLVGILTVTDVARAYLDKA